MLISFNSIHRTDPGWFGRYLLWEGMRQSITLEVLREMFGGHIERYQEIYRAQRSSHASQGHRRTHLDGGLLNSEHEST
ncbi:hypothetical protein KKF91_12845 [Myxococcota bacterium]|nr:hypothetical protein [Myxococcota bacterium]MBU1431422.1 hypothetical protein [Myxococcota bacterium]